MIITEYDGSTIDDVKALFTQDQHETLDEYFSFLLEKEYLFLTETPELYPKIREQWESPYVITNSIIDADKNSTHDYEHIITNLDDLGCQSIEFRFFDEVTLEELEAITKAGDLGGIRGFQFIIPYNESITFEPYAEFLKKNQRVSNIIIHSTPPNGAFNNEDQGILFTEDRINSEHDCGRVCKTNFSCNQSFFFESKSYNNCLNRKLSIDKHGNIKNCPSMKKSFGKANEIPNFSTIANDTDFQKLWRTNKDQIAICKDCEFRYICLDCRAYTKDEHDNYSKPLKCNYDPYTATWQEL
jgi:SPASM domain peptide maturase of grasp-with-spasm system